MKNQIAFLTCFFLLYLGGAAPAADFVVKPYLQHPDLAGISIYWFSRDEAPGTVQVEGGGASTSDVVPAEALMYHPDEWSGLPEADRGASLFRHRVRIQGLEAGKEYGYTVKQGEATFESRFRTVPSDARPIRFIVYGDCETEPESTGEFARWSEPGGDRERKYVADQTVGYTENLRIIEARKPDFIAIAGDLVESGGEQRDWDEFWRHNAGALGDLAGHVPLYPAIGNHDIYGGPGDFGGYGDEASRRALDKYKTYFEVPDNGAANTENRERYYRVDYGPITLITLDSSNGLPNNTNNDTNFFFEGKDSEGVEVVDFHPGEQLDGELSIFKRTVIEVHIRRMRSLAGHAG